MKLATELLLIECVCVLCIFVGVLLPVEVSFQRGDYSAVVVSNCGGLSLEKTADCLVGYVAGFYNYTERSDKLRDIEDIKENGGDCYDYNMLYKGLFEELGFNSFAFSIMVGDTGHRIAIVSNEGVYCLLDQLAKPKCNFIEVDDENKT